MERLEGVKGAAVLHDTQVQILAEPMLTPLLRPERVEGAGVVKAPAHP